MYRSYPVFVFFFFFVLLFFFWFFIGLSYTQIDCFRCVRFNFIPLHLSLYLSRCSNRWSACFVIVRHLTTFFYLDFLVILAHFKYRSIFLGDNNQYTTIYRFNIRISMLLKTIHSGELCGKCLCAPWNEMWNMKFSHFRKFPHFDPNDLCRNQHFQKLIKKQNTKLTIVFFKCGKDIFKWTRTRTHAHTWKASQE